MTPTLAFIDSPAAIAGFVVLVIGLLLVDLFLFARGRTPELREALIWSVGWFVLALLMTPVLLALEGSERALDYTTVYLIERSLSLDNLFVFLLLFGYFAIPEDDRPRLLFLGIVFALIVRGAAILAGTALLEEFHFIIYVLGATLLLLAYRMYGGIEEHADPSNSFAVKAARRIKKDASPAFLAVVSIVLADIAFAIDSIPAAFAVTTDSLVIWMANAFALLGLRALFVLVEDLVHRFRYLSQTIALILGFVAVKLLIEDLYKIPPAASLVVVVVGFAIGIAVSIIADRRDDDDDGGTAKTPPAAPRQPDPQPSPSASS